MGGIVSALFFLVNLKTCWTQNGETLLMSKSADGQQRISMKGFRVMAKKETIKVPTKKETTAASKLLRAGNSAGARVMAEKSVASRRSKGK